MTEVSWFTFETVIASIRDYIKKMNTSFKRHLLIMDNAPWHRKAERLIRELDEYKDIRDVLDIEFLPPYSPDLNPIERVWRITRREKTHNKYFGSKEILKDTLDGFFADFSVSNEKLSSLCQSKHK
jgi:transposase